MCCCQLPDATFAIYDGVLCRVFDFPFAFTKDLQPGGNQSPDAISPRVDVLKPTLTDFARLSDTGVIRQRNGTFISAKMESIKPLRSAQGQPEYAFNHPERW